MVAWQCILEPYIVEVLGYIMMRMSESQFMPQIFFLSVMTSFVDEEVENGVAYNYSLAAINIGGPGEFASVTGIMPAFKVKVPEEEESPALGGVFVLLAMLVGMAATMMRRKT